MLSPKNLIALGVGFLLAIVFWMVSSSSESSRDSEPKKQDTAIGANEPGELDRIEHAVRLARAWHATTTGRMGAELFQTEEDVVCPSDTHIVTRSSPPPGRET